MNRKINIVLADFSRQLGKDSFFKYKRTYLYSIRINGQEAIQLTEIEYKICLLLKEKRNRSQIEKELLFEKKEIDKAYERLQLLGIIEIFNDYNQYNFKILQPFVREIEGVRHFPRTIVWNITNQCNLACRHCIEKCFENRNRDIQLSQALIRKLLDEMDDNGLERLQISGGEPTCSPIFQNIVEIALEKDICIDIFTNAININDTYHELFKRYIVCKPNTITFHISIDGDEKSHNYLRGNDKAYQKTIDNVKKIISYGGKIYVETIIHRKNLNILEEVINILIGLNITYVYMHPMFHPEGENKIYEKQLIDEERLQVFMSMTKLKKKYKDVIEIKYVDPFFPIVAYYLNKKIKIPFKAVQSKNIDPVNCVAGLDKMFINSEGEVYPCLMYDKMKRDYCGNILEQNLMELWKSNGMNFVRRPIYESMLKCAACDYNRVCVGKIKSCRRAIEIVTNNYMGLFPACEDLFT